MKTKIKKILLELLFFYATTFPSSGLITEIKDYSSQIPEDIDEHMFI